LSAKVYDVIPNRVLISEMNIAHLMSAQVLPEFSFCWRHITMKFFGAREDFWCGALMHQDSDPLPASPNWRTQLGEGQF
jgi:hypothetical protein